MSDVRLHFRALSTHLALTQLSPSYHPAITQQPHAALQYIAPCAQPQLRMYVSTQITIYSTIDCTSTHSHLKQTPTSILQPMPSPDTRKHLSTLTYSKYLLPTSTFTHNLWPAFSSDTFSAALSLNTCNQHSRSSPTTSTLNHHLQPAPSIITCNQHPRSTPATSTLT